MGQAKAKAIPPNNKKQEESTTLCPLFFNIEVNGPPTLPVNNSVIPGKASSQFSSIDLMSLLLKETTIKQCQWLDLNEREPVAKKS